MIKQNTNKKDKSNNNKKRFNIIKCFSWSSQRFISSMMYLGFLKDFFYCFIKVIKIHSVSLNQKPG